MLISVCMATYNGEAFILDQLKSILPQLSNEDEIIISDDNSTDSTVDFILSLNEPRIRVIRGNLFKNHVTNFENALKHCRGDIIFLSDQDDVWHNNKIALMSEVLKDGYDLVLSDCSIVNNNFDVLASSFFELNKSKPGFLNNLFKNSFMGCCMGFNRNLLDKVLPFPNGLLMHDVWIGLVGEAFYKVKFLYTPLVSHRKHNKNTSTTAIGKSRYTLMEKLRFRVFLIKCLINRLILNK